MKSAFVEQGGEGGRVPRAVRRAADERLERRLARRTLGLGWLWRWLHRLELERGSRKVLWSCPSESREP